MSSVCGRSSEVELYSIELSSSLVCSRELPIADIYSGLFRVELSIVDMCGRCAYSGVESRNTLGLI